MHDDFVRLISERILAAQQGEGNNPKEANIVFVVGSEYFAIPILMVREVLRTPQLTPVPTAPGYIQGVFSHKGRVIPAIDTAKRFHGTLVSSRLPSHLIVVEHQGMQYGFLVDRVVDAVPILPDALQAISLDSPHHLSREYLLWQFPMAIHERNKGFQYDFFIASPKVKDTIQEIPKVSAQEKVIFVLNSAQMIEDLEREAAGL